MVACLERGADCLHMVQLMPLPSLNLIILHHLYPDWFCLSGSGLPKLSWKKRPLNGCVCFIIELTTIIMNSDILVTDVCRQHKTSYYDNFDNQQLQDQVRVVCDARKIFLLHRNRQRFCKNSE